MIKKSTPKSTEKSLPYPPQAAIGIMDSGFGGLSVLAALQELMPEARYLYLADHAFFPYGGKTEADVIARVTALAQHVIKLYGLDILVLACNTASTVALPALRALGSIPVVGVVPAIKPAAALSRSKVIGLLATDGTVRRPYTDELIASFASDCQIERLGSARLVTMAEEKLSGGRVDPAELAAILAPLAAAPGLDTVVLACTHFPHLRAELAAALPQVKHWVDSGAAIARRTLALINSTTSPAAGSAVPARYEAHHFIFTVPADSSYCSPYVLNFLKQGFGFSAFTNLQMSPLR